MTFLTKYAHTFVDLYLWLFWSLFICVVIHYLTQYIWENL